MTIGDFLGFSTYGAPYSTYGAAYGQGAVNASKPQAQARPAVTLEAERDPHTPYQYSVTVKQQVIPPPDAATEIKSAGKKANQNNDPVSRAFLAVANYQLQPTYHRIDIEV